MDRYNTTDSKIRLSLSKDNYNTKEEVKKALSAKTAREIGKDKIMFKTQDLSLQELIDKLTSGYCFCSLFNLKDETYIGMGNQNPFYKKYLGFWKIDFKRNEFFLGTQILPIDIDKTDYIDMYSFISKLSIKPTFAYYTYSDKPDSRRFRLIYVFSDILNYSQLKVVSKALNQLIEDDTEEPLEDKCNEIPAQYFNGTQCKEIYTTESIYNFAELISKLPESKVSEVKIKEQPKPKKDVKVVDINPILIEDMRNESYDVFMSHNRPKYHICYRTESNIWIDGLYQKVDDNFFKLYYNRSKVKNGSCRRKKLYNRMLQRIYAYPDLQPEDILVNAYEDLNRFFDNTDTNDFITIDCLVKNVKSAFQKSREEIEEVLDSWIDWNNTTRPKMILKKGIGTGKASKLCKEIRYNEISEVYDDSLTDEENLKNISKIGLNISQSTLTRYKKSKGLTDKVERNNKILALYDSRLSLKDNLEVLEDNDIKISKRTLQRILKDSDKIIKETISTLDSDKIIKDKVVDSVKVTKSSSVIVDDDVLDVKDDTIDTITNTNNIDNNTTMSAKTEDMPIFKESGFGDWGYSYKPTKSKQQETKPDDKPTEEDKPTYNSFKESGFGDWAYDFSNFNNNTNKPIEPQEPEQETKPDDKPTEEVKPVSNNIEFDSNGFVKVNFNFGFGF